MTLKHDADDWDDLCTVSTFDKGSPIEDKLTEIEFINSNNVTPSSPLVSTPISLLVQVLLKQLCMLTEKDSSKATSLYNNICKKLYQMQLLDETYSKSEFEEMRSQYQVALNQLVNVTNDSELPFKFHTAWPIDSVSQPLWSRYMKDFEEICFIASGGFGQVYKAKNCLDGMEYAIKKINIRAKDIDSVSKHFDEVKTFASLSHPNIVPYKAAWLEPYFTNDKLNKIENVNENSFDTNSNFEESENYISKKSSNIEILFENTTSASTRSYLENNKSVTEYSTESIDNCRALCKISKQSTNYFGTLDLQWATLYIQMEFCEKTLKTWLQERNDRFYRGEYQQEISNIKESMSMFTQLVKGVNYIHNLKIVHHDIKPTNIFIKESNSLNIKLGDFGLACPLQRSYHIPASGTCLYAAPEQLQGQCHEKNDIFSVGLVLLELIQLFCTDMEKVETFKILRSGKVPEYVTKNYPKLGQIIGKLAENNIEDRMDSEELLYVLKKFNENRDDTIVALKNEITTKDKIIQEKEEEIEKLKKMLSFSTINS